MGHTKAATFWSYAHRDDATSRGHIHQLGGAIADEYELLTGVPMEFFRDVDNVKLGDSWRERIDDALTEAAFLLPVLTPTYFSRQECRKELLFFLGEAKSLGVDSLIIPILYVPVNDLDGESSDELKREISQIQWMDWSELRLEDLTSAVVRRGVNRIAARMAEVAERLQDGSSSRQKTAENAILIASEQLAEPGEGVEEPGVVDLMAAMERVLPQWLQTIEQFPSITEEIGALIIAATDRIAKAEEQGQPTFATRLRVAQELAEHLEDPVARMNELMGDYTQQLVDLDPGVRAAIETIAGQALDETDLRTVAEAFSSIKGMVAASRGAATSAATLQAATGETAKLSKDLRPVLNRLGAALRSYSDSQSIVDRWEVLIDETHIPLGA